VNTNQIQERLDALARGMTAKAVPQADARFSINSHAEPYVCLAWTSRPKAGYADKHEWFKGSPEQALAAADAYVAALPSPEQARMTAFLSALSEAVELGKKNDIDVEFVNPLVALMKKLSKNALRHHPTDSRSTEGI
jgi:hypothetical protein